MVLILLLLGSSPVDLEMLYYDLSSGIFGELLSPEKERIPKYK